jgi:hypothetical protein
VPLQAQTQTWHSHTQNWPILHQIGQYQYLLETFTEGKHENSGGRGFGLSNSRGVLCPVQMSHAPNLGGKLRYFTRGILVDLVLRYNKDYDTGI